MTKPLSVLMAMTESTMARNSGQLPKKVTRMPGLMVSAIIVPISAWAQSSAGRGRRMVPPFMPTTAPATIGPIRRAAGMPVSSSAAGKDGGEQEQQAPLQCGIPAADARGHGSGRVFGRFRRHVGTFGIRKEAALGRRSVSGVIIMGAIHAIRAACGSFLRYAALSPKLCDAAGAGLYRGSRCKTGDRPARIGQ